MEAIKLSLSYETPQIGLLFRRYPGDKKKQIYLIQLNGLIFIGDPDKITEVLYAKHAGFLKPEIVNPSQIKRFVEKLLVYLQNQIADYEKNQQLQMQFEN